MYRPALVGRFEEQIEELGCQVLWVLPLPCERLLSDLGLPYLLPSSLSPYMYVAYNQYNPWS